MKPYSLAWPIWSTFIFYSGGSNVVRGDKSCAILQPVTSMRGDHQSPTAQEFWTRRDRSVIGSYSDVSGTTVGSALVCSYNDFPASLVSPAPPYDALYNQVLGKISEQVRGKADLAVDLAELRQTRRMISQYYPAYDRLQKNMDRFGRYTRAFKSRWVDSGLLTGRKIGAKWLEYRYGWSPLLKDIHESAEQLLNLSTLPLTSFFARSSESVPIGGSFSRNGFNLTASGSASFRAEMKLLLKQSRTTPQALAGFTSLNPVSLAWELLPYSFVIDWFYNVGDYLRNAETSLIYGNRFHSGYVTYTWLSEGSVVATSSSMPGGRVSGSGTFRRSGKKRVPLTGYPLPRPPVLKAELGSGRLLNAAALLSQFIGKH